MSAHTKVLDSLIERVGDKFDKVTLGEIQPLGSDFVNFLLREGYTKRRAWRISNQDASGRRKVAAEKAKSQDLTVAAVQADPVLKAHLQKSHPGLYAQMFPEPKK